MHKHFRGISILLAVTAIGSGRAVAQFPKEFQIQAVQAMRHQVAEQVARASVQVQEQAAKIPLPVTAPINASDHIVQTVSASEKAALLSKVGEFQSYAVSEKDMFSRLATGSLIAAALLGLVGSVASFLKWNKLGGIASLIAVAVIGFFQAYPVSPLSDFYRSLATQATALKVDCDLKEPFTLETYDSAVAQLKLLYLYEGDKRPKWGSSEAVGQDLARQLQTLRTASNRLEAKVN